MSSSERLSGLDEAFLRAEDGSAHMHIAGLMLLAGEPPAQEELCAVIAARLHLVPRYRQKLAFVPGGLSRPQWIDDPHFNLGYHVRRTALPPPGGEGELRALASRILSQRLDRSKPLWELWLVEGVADRRFALISKSHHALVDGIAGVDVTSVLFDPVPAPGLPAETPPAWVARPEPSSAQLAGAAVLDRARELGGLARGALGRALNPAAAAQGARAAAGGLGALAKARIEAGAESPYNVPIGSQRRFTWMRASLADAKTVKDTLGGTVNDVVLATVAGALRRHLRRRGERIPETLEAMVPVSTRAPEDARAPGNRIAPLFAPLPLSESDPVKRLRRVTAAMAGVKESRQALGARVLTELAGFAPPSLMAQAARQLAGSRVFHLTVTNVPGPQFSLYLLGRRLIEVFPMVPLAPRHALGVAVMSYDGRLGFGVVGDRDALHDVEELADHLEASFAELLDAATATFRVGESRRFQRRRPTLETHGRRRD